MNNSELAFYNDSEHYKSEIFLVPAPHHRDKLERFYIQVQNIW